MDLPWAIISLASVSGAFALSRFAPQHLVAGSFVYTLIVLEFAATVVGVVWKAILYPRFFSPLRHLPTVPVSQ